MSAIRREWSVQWRNLPGELGFVLGGFVLGRVLVAAIGLFVKDLEWLPFGVLFAAFGLIAVFFTVSMQFVIGLNHAILMSRTRTGFIVGNYLIGMLTLLLGFLLTLFLGWIEFVSANAIHPQMLGVISKIVSILLHPLFLIGFPVFGVIFADFIGALLARFGKRAGWTLWGLWMFGSLVLPRMMNASEGKDTLLTRAGQVLSSLISGLTPVSIAVIVLVLAAAALAATIAMSRTKQAEA